MGRLSKFDYFSRSLADVFSFDTDYTLRCDYPQAGSEREDPQNTAAARLSEGWT